jgi:hypothetical protein
MPRTWSRCRSTATARSAGETGSAGAVDGGLADVLELAADPRVVELAVPRELRSATEAATQTNAVPAATRRPW